MRKRKAIFQFDAIDPLAKGMFVSICGNEKKKDKISRFISNMVNHRDAMQQIKAIRVVRGYDFPEKNVCYNHN